MNPCEHHQTLDAWVNRQQETSPTFAPITIALAGARIRESPILRPCAPEASFRHDNGSLPEFQGRLRSRFPILPIRPQRKTRRALSLRGIADGESGSGRLEKQNHAR